MTFICHPNCSSCQKALRWMSRRGIPYTYRDIKKDKPTYDEIKAWQARSRLPLKRFFNTSGLRYRTQKLAQRIPLMNEDAQLQLLASDGMLVKRPLLIGEDFVLVGFREAEWEARLAPKMKA